MQFIRASMYVIYYNYYHGNKTMILPETRSVNWNNYLKVKNAVSPYHNGD